MDLPTQRKSSVQLLKKEMVCPFTGHSMTQAGSASTASKSSQCDTTHHGNCMGENVKMASTDVNQYQHTHFPYNFQHELPRVSAWLESFGHTTGNNAYDSPALTNAGESTEALPNRDTNFSSSSGDSTQENGVEELTPGIPEISKPKWRYGMSQEEEDLHRDPERWKPLYMNLLHEAITEVQSKFKLGYPKSHVFALLLEGLLTVTCSEYGFIGEHVFDKNGKRQLKTLAITDIAWNDETRAHYQANYRQGLIFSNLETLFGTVVKTGEHLIANDPSTDPRGTQGRLPAGHPPLKSFLGLPLLLGDRVIGSVGVSNRPSGYSDDLIQFIKPYTSLMSSFLAMHSMDVTTHRLQEENRMRINMQRHVEQQNRDAHWLRSVTNIIRDEPDVDSVLKASVEEMQKYFRPLVCGVYVEQESKPVRLSPSNRPLSNVIPSQTLTGSHDNAWTLQHARFGGSTNEVKQLLRQSAKGTAEWDAYISRRDSRTFEKGIQFLDLFMDNTAMAKMENSLTPNCFQSRNCYLVPLLYTSYNEELESLGQGRACIVLYHDNHVHYYRHCNTWPLSEILLDTVQQITTSLSQTSLLAHNNKLVARKRTAEAASRARSEFLSTMSHEIRTPLYAIIANAEMLLSTPCMSHEQKEMVSTIKSSGDHLMSLINDVLDLSKFESGSIVLDARTCSLQGLLDSCLDVVSHQAVQKNLQLNYIIQPGTPAMIVLDDLRLKQIITNLLSNAVKFTKKGEIVVKAKVAAGREDFLSIEVSDTGIGIAEDKLPIMFSRFTQADSSITREYGGTGLGLAISKHLSLAMGGDISIRSEVGKGTTFSLVIRFQPAIKEQVPEIFVASNDAGLGLQAGDCMRQPLPISKAIVVSEGSTNNSELESLSTKLTVMGCTIIEKYSCFSEFLSSSSLESCLAQKKNIAAEQDTLLQTPAVLLVSDTTRVSSESGPTQKALQNDVEPEKDANIRKLARSIPLVRIVGQSSWEMSKTSRSAPVRLEHQQQQQTEPSCAFSYQHSIDTSQNDAGIVTCARPVRAATLRLALLESITKHQEKVLQQQQETQPSSSTSTSKQVSTHDVAVLLNGVALSKDGAKKGGRSPTTADGKSYHVMVVEDNVVSQKVTKKLLERLGHTVVIAGGGQEAIDTAAEVLSNQASAIESADSNLHHQDLVMHDIAIPKQTGEDKKSFDLVLMDIHMPGMDGFRATEGLRKVLGSRCPPIFAMTASKTYLDMDQCKVSGMEETVVPKPVSMSHLRDFLSKCLSNHKEAKNPAERSRCTSNKKCQEK